jgi:hypothetical protein
MATRPQTYLEFIGSFRPDPVVPEPGQRVYCAVAYDGWQPVAFKGEDAKLFREIFGKIKHIPDELRTVVVTVAGARSGKTYHSSLRLLHLGLTLPLDGIVRGQVAYGAIVAPDKKTAREALNYIRGAVEMLPGLSKFVTSEGTDHLEITRQDGKIIRFEVFAASAGGKTMRGRWYFGVLMDEAAFFYGEDGYSVTDEDIFNAVVSRILPGGQLLVPSTPWAKLGLLYDQYTENWGHPVTCLAAHASTRAMRSDPKILSVVTREEKRNPDNAAREYGAVFLSTVAALWFSDDELTGSIDLSLPIEGEGPAPGPGTLVGAGGDLGFSKNSSALGIAHRTADLVRVVELLEQKPEPGKPLKPSKVIKDFAEVMQRHRCGALMADQHYKETANEHLEEEGLYLEDAPTDPAEAFATLRLLMREHRVKLPNNPLLLGQLRAIKARPTPGGGTTIVLPKTKDGRHADLAVAAALAAHQVWMRPAGEVPKPKPKRGSFEAEQASIDRAEEQREQRVAQNDNRAWWETDQAAGGYEW